MNPYLIIGGMVAGLALAVGGFLYGEHVQKTTDTVAIEKQSTAAEHLRAELAIAVASHAAAQAEFTRSLDAANATNTAAIAARSDALQRDYADRVRQLAQRRTSCGSTVPTEAAHPSGAAAGARVSDAELQRRVDSIAGRVKRIADAADANAALIRDVCVPFAASVGR